MAEQEVIQLGTPTIPFTFAPFVAVGNPEFPVGTPVTIGTDGTATPANASVGIGAMPNVYGLAKTQGLEGERCIVQYGAILKLSESQWRAVNEDNENIRPGARYFLAVTQGQITRTQPTSGDMYVLVGKCVSTTEMLILISDFGVVA